MKRITLLLTLVSLALVASAASAASDLGFKRIGASIGIIDPEGLGTTFSLGAFVDHGTIAPHFGLESRLDYWSQSESFFGTQTSMRDAALGARVKYTFETSNPKLRPFAGAGLGIHFLKAETTVPPPFGPLTTEVSSTELGFHLGGGIATPVSPKADLIGETWYGVVDGANSFALRGAVSFKLGQ